MWKYKPFWISFLVIFITFTIVANQPVRIKDIASIQGIKENQLLGFGLVTGLGGQGDSKSFGLTKKMLYHLAENYGFKLLEDDLKSKNIAAVLVTARLGGFSRIGDKLDVTVSSIGDAKSLAGGILLMTPLKGANGTIYAVAQGRIIAGSKKQDAETTGSVPQGAIIEKETVSTYLTNNRLNIILNRPDFSTVFLVKEAILSLNQELQVSITDPGLIEVQLGEEELKDKMGFISQLELLTVVPDKVAAIVIDKKTGVIVAGNEVVIQECSVSTPSVGVTVSANSGNDKSTFQITSKTVGELVNILNQASLDTNEIIALLEALHKAGALNAKLIIL
ncbi:MAG: flagellar basal body P-ring protein FlgI [Spirochaetes bacterium]|nr:flagellar basal body P-ring protein FlgI [Spirochaetota bacterium]